MIENVRPEPELSWRSASALKDQIPVLESQALRHQAGRFPELQLVVTRLSHGGRNAMSTGYQALLSNITTRSLSSRQLLHRFTNTLCACLNEARMIIKNPKLIDFGYAFTHFRLRSRYIFAVLPAS